METDIVTSEKKNDLTLDMVMRVVKLSKLQIRNVFVSVLQAQPPAADAVLTEEAVFYLLVADMLENLTFLSGEQRLLLSQLLRETRQTLELPAVPEGCGTHLAFGDGRYATWTGAMGWTELESGEKIDFLPRRPLETIAYNLDELYRRGVHIIETRAGLNVKNDNAGSVEKPGDVCERPADAVSG
ncbi:hypothetical protein EBZ80_20795 [bacterium]|nr:hypothetical protein [Betaproteobacteria bacterium]NDE17367.1 hypothetical protein [bacterium]